MKPTFENMPEMIMALMEKVSRIERRLETPKPTPAPDRIGTKEAAKFLGISTSKVYKLSMKKEIPFKKFGGKVIFSRKELETWIESKTIDREAETLAVLRKRRGEK